MVIKALRADELAKEMCKLRNRVLKTELWGTPAFKRKTEVVEPGTEGGKAGKCDVTDGKRRESMQWREQWAGWMISAQSCPADCGALQCQAVWVLALHTMRGACECESEPGGEKGFPHQEDSLVPLNCQFHCIRHTDPGLSLLPPSASWPECNWLST